MAKLDFLQCINVKYFIVHHIILFNLSEGHYDSLDMFIILDSRLNIIV